MEYVQIDNDIFRKGSKKKATRDEHNKLTDEISRLLKAQTGDASWFMFRSSHEIKGQITELKVSRDKFIEGDGRTRYGYNQKSRSAL